MTDAVQVALITSVPPTIVAAGALIVSLKNKAALNELHLSVNSRLDQLVTASRAQGRQEERDSRIEGSGRDA